MQKRAVLAGSTNGGPKDPPYHGVTGGPSWDCCPPEGAWARVKPVGLVERAKICALQACVRCWWCQNG
eukprot:8744564-Lingulodinium_polyedra.AAC.1